MPTILPLVSEPLYRFASTLDGVAYRFRVRWNSTEARWYMDVYEYDGTPIVAGVALVIGAYLGRASTHQLFRRGILVMRTKKDAAPAELADAGFDDVGKRVELVYFTTDEAAQEILAAIGEASR